MSRASQSKRMRFAEKMRRLRERRRALKSGAGKRIFVGVAVSLTLAGNPVMLGLGKMTVESVTESERGEK